MSEEKIQAKKEEMIKLKIRKKEIIEEIEEIQKERKIIQGKIEYLEGQI